MCGCEKKRSHCGCANRGFQPPQPSISIGVQNLLGCDCILFTGTYDKTSIRLTPTSTDDNYAATGVFNTSLCNSGYGSWSATGIANSSALLGSPIFTTENYYFASYDDSLSTKYGEVNFEATYPSNTVGGITPSTVQSFDVSSKSGIYSNVKRVIIDFNNDVRVLYFIGKC